MENKPTPNADFENYIRKNLQQIDASPDDALWSKIASQQAPVNKWLKIRRYGMYAAGAALLLVASIGIWRSQHSSASPLEQPTNQAQKLQMPMDTIPMATVVPVTEPNTLSLGSSKTVNKRGFVPNFSSRTNSVPAATMCFQAEAGIHYQSPISGTSVTIPANSLVDQNGQAVQGEAEFYFREYRSIGDYLASGIPMHYSDNRGQYFFNSGGMFEVRVSQAGTALNMGVGQTYDVVFAPTEKLEKASLYYLDDQTKAWRFLPDAAFGQASLTAPPVVTESTVAINNIKGQSVNCRPFPDQLAENPSPVELVKLGVKTGYELATGAISMPTWFLKNPYLTDNQLLFRMERGLIQIKRHHDHDQLFFPQDLNKFFSELAAFKDCYFTYNQDSMSGTKNAKYLTAGDYWQRIIVVHEGGEKCFITLYDGNENQMQFHTDLKGSTENKNFDPQAVMAEYDRLRRERQQEFALKNKALRYFLYAASAFKPEAEWCFSPNQWLAYFEQNHPLMAQRYKKLIDKGLSTNDQLAADSWKKWQQMLRNFRFEKREKDKKSVSSKNDLQYALSLSNFGIYNCDQIFRLGGEATQYVLTSYKTAAGTRIIPAFVSILERRTRIFFTLPAPDRLISSAGRNLDVIVTDKEGRQYHFPAEKYAAQKFDKTGLTVLSMNDVTDLTRSPKAWADLLEI